MNRAERRAMRRRDGAGFGHGSGLSADQFAALLAARGYPCWALPCDCIEPPCHCCGKDATVYGGPNDCRLGGSNDRRHRWLVAEFAPFPVIGRGGGP